MSFYFVILAFLGILVFLEIVPVDKFHNQYINRKLLMWIGLAGLACLVMFRSATVGNDTLEYIQFFTRIMRENNLLYSIRNTSFESGYVVLNYVVSRFTSEPQWIFILSSAFAFFSVGRFFSRYSEMPVLSVYLFFTLMTFDFFLSGVRQMIAIAIILFGYNALLEKKTLKFIVLTLIATLFHNSAILFIPVYFLVQIKERRKFLISLGVVTVGCFLGAKPIIRIILKIFTRYQYYEGGSYFESGSKLSIILYLAVYAAVLLAGQFVDRSSRQETAVNAKEEMEYRMMVLLPVVCIFGFIAPVFSRLLRYFQLFLYLYYPNVLCRKDTYNRALLIILSMIAFALYALTIHILRTPAWYTTYPYAFFWND